MRTPRTAVFREIWPQCHRYIRHLLMPEQHLVDDFLHEAAVDVVVRWELKGPMSCNEAAAIIKQAAKYDVINHRQKQGRRATSPVAMDDEILLNHADPNASNEILAALGCIDCDQLMTQLLSEPQRAIIVKVDIEGLTHKDAAEQLGITVGQLQYARREALNKLRRHLPPPPGPPRKETPR